jgi:hypothetical protein
VRADGCGSRRPVAPDLLEAFRLTCWVSRWWSQWRRALYFVQPVLEWQKKRFRECWRDLSRSRIAVSSRIVSSAVSSAAGTSPAAGRYTPSGAAGRGGEKLASSTRHSPSRRHASACALPPVPASSTCRQYSPLRSTNVSRGTAVVAAFSRRGSAVAADCKVGASLFAVLQFAPAARCCGCGKVVVILRLSSVTGARGRAKSSPGPQPATVETWPAAGASSKDIRFGSPGH